MCGGLTTATGGLFPSRKEIDGGVTEVTGAQDSRSVTAQARRRGAGLMGRREVAAFRGLFERQGWLDAAAPLPGDAVMAAAGSSVKRARSTISSAEAHRELVARRVKRGIGGVAIHAALRRDHR